MELRSASLDDADLLYRWRLDDERDEWWQGDHPSYNEHLNWLLARLESPTCRIYLALIDGIRIGQARIDSNGEISFSIARAHRRLGAGSRLVAQATFLASRELNLRRLKASVDLANNPGVLTLLNAGYRPVPSVRFFRWP